MTYRAAHRQDYDWTLRGWIKWRWGMHKIKQGYCPLCNSSPPDPKCLVCKGTYEYGYKLTPGMRHDWEFWWYLTCGNLRRKKLGIFS